MRVHHVFASALVTIVACDEPVREPIDAEVIDSELNISENPPPPDAWPDAAPVDAGPPDATTAAAAGG